MMRWDECYIEKDKFRGLWPINPNSIIRSSYYERIAVYLLRRNAHTWIIESHRFPMYLTLLFFHIMFCWQARWQHLIHLVAELNIFSTIHFNWLCHQVVTFVNIPREFASRNFFTQYFSARNEKKNIFSAHTYWNIHTLFIPHSTNTHSIILRLFFLQSFKQNALFITKENNHNANTQCTIIFTNNRHKECSVCVRDSERLSEL